MDVPAHGQEAKRVAEPHGLSAAPGFSFPLGFVCTVPVLGFAREREKRVCVFDCVLLKLGA